MTAHMHRAENRVQHEHTLISICCICIFHIGYASCPTPVTHLTRTIPQPWMLFAISLNFHTVVLFLSPQESLQMTLFKALMAEQCLQSVMWRARGPRRGICANLCLPCSSSALFTQCQELGSSPGESRTCLGHWHWVSLEQESGPRRYPSLRLPAGRLEPRNLPEQLVKF